MAQALNRRLWTDNRVSFNKSTSHFKGGYITANKRIYWDWCWGETRQGYCQGQVWVWALYCCSWQLGLSKDIWCHVGSYSFVYLQITKSDIRPHVKWAVRLVIAYGRFKSSSKGLCGYLWVNRLTLSLPGCKGQAWKLGFWYCPIYCLRIRLLTIFDNNKTKTPVLPIKFWTHHLARTDGKHLYIQAWLPFPCPHLALWWADYSLLLATIQDGLVVDTLLAVISGHQWGHDEGWNTYNRWMTQAFHYWTMGLTSTADSYKMHHSIHWGKSSANFLESYGNFKASYDFYILSLVNII